MDNSIKRADMERLAQYRDTLCSRPRLTYLFFELTDACNLSCLHCGSGSCPQNKTYLPASDAMAVMDEVAARYNPAKIMICLSGGEPLLHPDLYRVAAHARQLGFSCGMTTNGTLIDATAARAIVEAGIQSVTFSLDGLRNTHDWFRNQPGSFDAAVAGVKHLLSAGRTLTQITTVIHQKNLHQLDAMYDFVSQLGVASWRVINLEPIGRALEHQDLLLTPPQLRTMLNFIRAKRFDPAVTMDVTYGCSHYLGLEDERMVRDNYFLCGSGIYVASVLCNGDIYSCMDIQRRPELVQGNIHRDSFTDVWENRFQAFRRDRTGDCSLCRDCADRAFCRGDAAHTWDYDEHRPLFCYRNDLPEKGD